MCLQKAPRPTVLSPYFFSFFSFSRWFDFAGPRDVDAGRRSSAGAGALELLPRAAAPAVAADAPAMAPVVALPVLVAERCLGCGPLFLRRTLSWLSLWRRPPLFL